LYYITNANILKGQISTDYGNTIKEKISFKYRIIE